MFFLSVTELCILKGIYEIKFTEMKKKIFSLLIGSVLTFLLVYNVGVVSNATSKSITLDFLSSQAVVCSSECTSYPGCTIKKDCSYVCVEHANDFECGLTTYKCSDLC